MYCPDCLNDYRGWNGRCPTCGELLLDETPAPDVFDTLPYPDLLDQVRTLGGAISIPARATAVERDSESSFPYFGYGFAWVCKIEGGVASLHLELETSETRRKRSRRFPWKGYGYAWTAAMRGILAGNAITLGTTREMRERRWRFPYFGFGYAWAGEMVGTCGDSLEIRLTTTTVARSRAQRIPYRGYGYAWLRECRVVVTLITTEPDSVSH